MSQFPDTEATRWTELIMKRVREKNPDMPTNLFNSIYSACFDVLTEKDRKAGVLHEVAEAAAGRIKIIGLDSIAFRPNAIADRYATGKKID